MAEQLVRHDHRTHVRAVLARSRVPELERERGEEVGHILDPLCLEFEPVVPLGERVRVDLPEGGGRPVVRVVLGHVEEELCGTILRRGQLRRHLLLLRDHAQARCGLYNKVWQPNRGTGQYSDEGVGGVPFHAVPYHEVHRHSPLEVEDDPRLGDGWGAVYPAGIRRAYVVQDAQGETRDLARHHAQLGGVPSAPLPMFQSLREDRLWLDHQGRQPRDRL
eukprot:2573640-Prymnesium_polylepis.1